MPAMGVAEAEAAHPPDDSSGDAGGRSMSRRRSSGVCGGVSGDGEAEAMPALGAVEATRGGVAGGGGGDVLVPRGALADETGRSGGARGSRGGGGEGEGDAVSAMKAAS